MADTDIDGGQPLPPPKRGNSFGNLKTKTVREVKRPVGRPPNEVPLVALTCKLMPDVKDRFEALETPFLETRQKGRRTDFVDALLISFEAAKASGTAEPAAPRQPRIPDTERKAGRTERRDVWFEPEVIQALETSSERTLSERIAKALKMAADCHRVQQENEELQRKLAEVTTAKSNSKGIKAA